MSSLLLLLNGGTWIRGGEGSCGAFCARPCPAERPTYSSGEGENSGPFETQDGWVTINGHHVLLRDPDENGGSGDPEGGEKPKFTETDYDMKPWGFSHNSEGELTLDNEERERYNTLLIGYETGSGQVIESLSGHAYDRAAQRNISPKEIADALDKSPTTSIESAGCDVYDSESHRVVVDRSAKRIVSVMRRRGI